MFAVCRVSGGIQVVSNTDFLRSKSKSFFFFFLRKANLLSPLEPLHTESMQVSLYQRVLF